MTEEQRLKTASAARRIALATAVISLWFIFTLAAMMAFQHYQAERILPQTEKQLESMRAELSEKGDDENYRETLRKLDFMYRRAYFTSRDQMLAGMYMLVIACVAVILAGAVYISASKYIPEMPDRNKRGKVAGNVILRNAVIKSIAVLAAAAVVFLLYSRTGNKTQPGKTINSDSKYASADERSLQWSQFRGGFANRNTSGGIFEFDTAWKIKSPMPGFSSPVVWNDKLFITGADRKKRSVFAYSTADGKLLWRHDADTVSQLPEVTDDTGYAAPTPVTDGHRVYAMFATGQLLCTDMEGKRVWKRDFGTPKILYGYASSPLLHEKYLILQFDTESEHILYALDAANGREIWKNERPKDTASSWASPSLAVLPDGSMAVVTVTCEFVEVFSLESGKTLWRKDCMSGEIAASPAYLDGMILTANANVSAFAFEPASGRQIWENSSIPLPDVSSATADTSRMYIFSSTGTASCLSLKGGSLLWEHEFDKGFYASPVALADKIILAVNMNGEMFFVRSGTDKFELAGTVKLGEPVVATPAVTKEGVFIRSHDNIMKLKPRTANK